MISGPAHATQEEGLGAAHAERAVRPDLDVQRRAHRLDGSARRLLFKAHQTLKARCGSRAAHASRVSGALAAGTMGHHRERRFPEPQLQGGEVLGGALHRRIDPAGHPAGEGDAVRDDRAVRQLRLVQAPELQARRPAAPAAPASAREVRHAPALAQGGQPAAGTLHDHPVRPRRDAVDKRAGSCRYLSVFRRLLLRYAAKSAGS